MLIFKSLTKSMNLIKSSFLMTKHIFNYNNYNTIVNNIDLKKKF